MPETQAASLPSLDWANSLPKDRIPAALSQLSALQGMLAARLMATAPVVLPTTPEWSLDIDAMIKKTGKSRRWLFQHKNLPFIWVISRKTIKGDETLLRKWISQQIGD